MRHGTMGIGRCGMSAIVAGMVGAAVSGSAAEEARPIHFVDLESNEVVEVRHSPLPGKAASLLPADGEWIKKRSQHSETPVDHS